MSRVDEAVSGPGLLSNLRLLAAAVPGARRVLIAVAGFSGVSSVLMLAPALFSVQVFDRVLSSRSGATLILLLCATLLCLAVCAVLDNVRGRLLVLLGKMLDERLAPGLTRTLFERPTGAPGSVATASLRDLATLRQALAGPPLVALFDAPWMLVVLVALWALHPALGLLATVGVLVVLFAMVWLERLQRQAAQESAAMGSAAARMLNDAVRQRDAWRSLGALPGLMLRLGRLRTSLAERQAPALSRSAVFGVVLRFSKQALQSTLLALGAWLVIGQDATPGVMIGATILFGRLLAPLEGLQSGWRALQEGRFAAARLGGSLTQRRGNGSVVADGAGSGRSAPPRETASPAPARPCAAPAISLLECSFGWPGASRPLLKGVTLKLAPGELIALIGPAASGKTTLARLLLGLVQPSLGQLRLAGRSWAQLEADGDAPVCGYLGHDPMLFEGTIADHIAGGNAGQAPGGAVADAATAAGLADWISLLPRGYETRLGRDALEPSSNQARALALARLLYARPQLVVIDEPGAVTDGATARALTDAIQGLHRSGATVLLCTGRMHWARLAPRWLVLREGAIVDDGPRDAVVQRLGLQDKPMAEVEP